MTFADAVIHYVEADKDRAPPAILKRMVQIAGAEKLATFKPGRVHDIVRELHPNVGNATRNRHGIVPFMAVYNFAVKRGWATPMVVERFTEEKPVTRSVDREWIAAFRAHCADPYVRAMSLLMFTTAMRLGSVVAIRPEWVDLQSRVIHVPKTKNGDPHDYLLTEEMAEELAALPPIAEFNKRDVIIGGRRRDPSRLFGFTYRSAVYRHWKRACNAAKIDYVPPHQAGRHSFATEMIVRNGVDVVTTAALGGWKDPSMLVRKYPHAEKMREVADRVFAGGRKNTLKVVPGGKG